MPECTINAASEDYADFIYRHNNMSLAQLYESLNAPCIQYINSEYAIVYSPLEPLLPLTLEHYTYSALPKLYTLLDTTSMDSAGILPVFNQPALGSRGTGVLIGFIDTGIDYQNPLFQNSDGTTRIAAIWDQSVPGEVFSLTSPRQEQQFQYGTYYTREQINEAPSVSTASVCGSIHRYRRSYGTFSGWNCRRKSEPGFYRGCPMILPSLWSS